MLLESLRPPLELILSWQTSQFPHGIRRGWGLVILIGFFLPICFIFVILRTYSRIRRRSFGIDDALIVFAVLFAAGVDASIILGFVRYGYDRHVWDVTQPMALQARKMVLVIEQLNSTSTCFTKISILFFYRRLAGGIHTSKFIRIVQANILFVAAYLLVFSVVLFLTCYPFESYWLMFDILWVQENTYKCFNEAANTIAANVFSILQDFIACGLPSVLLWKLQMRKKKKILLGSLLGLGILPCVAGILRLLYTIRLYSAYDSTWGAHPVFVWTVTETHLGILCACAPALHSYAKDVLKRSRLVSAFFRNLSSSYSFWRSSSSGGGGNGRGKRRSASGHIELEDSRSGGSEHARGRRGGGGGGGGGGRGGSKGAGVVTTTTTGTSTTRSDTLFSSTLDGREEEEVEVSGTSLPMGQAAKYEEEGSAAADFERRVGGFGFGHGGGQQQHQPLFEAAENARRRSAGMWYLETLPEVPPVRLPDSPPAAYLGGGYHQQQRGLEEGGLMRSEDEEEEEEQEIGIALTARPMTASSVSGTSRKVEGIEHV